MKSKIQHSHFMSDTSSESRANTHNFQAEYIESALHDKTNSTNNTLNTGATALISSGILILVIWSVAMLAGVYTTDGGQPVALETTPAAHSQSFAEQLPPAEATVIAGSLGVYHWHGDCPLLSAHSLRAGGRDSASLSMTHQLRLTRFEAGLRGLRPCEYCLHIEDWR